MIKWRNQREFENDQIEMGGLHRTMNFIGCIGHSIGWEWIVRDSARE